MNAPTTPSTIEPVPAAAWPTLAGFIHQHNRDAAGRLRCLHADQGTTAELHAQEMARLAPDEGAFWCVRERGEPVAFIGCEFDATLGRGWLRGPLLAPAAGDDALALRLVGHAERQLPALHTFDAFPSADDDALNRCYAQAGYQRVAVHRVLQAPARAAAPDGGGSPPVRDATAADLPALLALHHTLFPGSYLRDDEFAAALQPGDRCLLAATGPDAALAGYLTARDDAAQDEVYVDYVGVADGARGRGLGAALLHAAMRWAAGRGRAHVALTVRDDRVPALALYQRAGFVQVSAGAQWRKQRAVPAAAAASA